MNAQILKECIDAMDPEDRERVESIAAHIRAAIAVAPEQGVVALALVSLEIQDAT